MVMHARKPQRISDGYFEKHQAHPYQNSKYSSSKDKYADKFNHERMRDSPNGNSYRSVSPESQSPYSNKNAYVSKTREKERENRDYKSRDKYPDYVDKSPSEKRSRESRDVEHRTNHDRNSSEKVVLHPIHKNLSSQNSSRDVSQRKPLQHTSYQDKKSERGDERERERVPRVGDWSEHLSSSGKKYYYNCKTEVSQWEKPREWLLRPPQQYGCSNTPRPHHHDSRHSNSASRQQRDKHFQQQQQQQQQQPQQQRNASSTNATPHYWNNQHKEHDTSVNSNSETQQAQDMDICSGSSTPTSEVSYTHHSLTTSNEVHGRLLSQLPQVSKEQSSSSSGTVLASSLSGGEHHANVSTAVGTSMLQPLRVDTSVANTDPGPPTPTHSEHHDATDVRKVINSPPSGSSLASISSSLATLRSQGPNLTPSLSNFYRDDLVSHVRGWPADVLEKQAQKQNEESINLGSMQCTRVSAELKSARSLVRLRNIQATLQEQRVLFLCQQIKILEEMKSQNSFMGDDG